MVVFTMNLRCKNIDLNIHIIFETYHSNYTGLQYQYA